VLQELAHGDIEPAVAEQHAGRSIQIDFTLGGQHHERGGDHRLRDAVYHDSSA
jgi:hypothetical protein